MAAASVTAPSMLQASSFCSGIKSRSSPKDVTTSAVSFSAGTAYTSLSSLCPSDFHPRNSSFCLKLRTKSTRNVVGAAVLSEEEIRQFCLKQFEARKALKICVSSVDPTAFVVAVEAGAHMLGKKTQEGLLERVAQEVRNKREGDRESTPLVRALTWAFRNVKKPEDVEALVGGLDLPLPVFTTTIQKLGIEGKPMPALVVFEWLQTSGGNQPNVYTYNSLLGALKSNGHWKIAERVYHEMLQTGVSPDIVTQNTLISMYEQQGAYTYALKIYKNLKPLGLQPSPFTVRNVIQILERKGDVEAVLNVFVDFKQQCRREAESKGKKRENQIEATESRRYSEQREQLEIMVRQMCFKKISQLLARDGNREEVIRLWSKMRSKEVQLSRNFYENLIRTCGDGEEDHKFVKILYLDMRKQDVPISVSLCNHVIRTLALGKMWWAALEVFEHMVQVGPQPNSYTHKLMLSQFHILLNSARRRKIWRWALQLLDKMIQRGVEPDRFAWNAALIACSKAGETDSAISVFKRMIGRGQRPGVLSYGALLSALEKSNHFTGARMVWEHMKSMGMKPNVVAYTTMISACGRSGSYGEALQLLDEMPANGIQPTLITYNALITACARAGDGERALDVIQQMTAAKIQPDCITYAQLIEAMANEGRWKQATEAYETMQKLKLQPPAYAYEAVLRVCKANNIPVPSSVLETDQIS
ncbi:hypothetical protein R1sor_022272 [Riccia sorocarpa]|uniref:Pentatricopeptide repeat-containing protein n=1 Tax=Riccia sorocarpa TaxID=122646 RepID=A0ABD3GN67_9MARC